jgi:hypothetical protein
MVDSFAFNFRDEMKFLATSCSLTKIAESYLTFNLLTWRAFFFESFNIRTFDYKKKGTLRAPGAAYIDSGLGA